MKSGSPPRRRNLAALIVTLLVGWIACADAQSPPMEKARPADKAALLAELMKLEVASWQYLKDANVPAMKQYLGDDALMIFSNGKRFTKAQLIDAMPYIQLDSFTIEPHADIKVWTPEVATLVYRVTYTTGMRNTQASTMKVLSSNTYARRNGHWVSELYQETPAP
jgi:Domain of unknown function (DUF4440)